MFVRGWQASQPTQERKLILQDEQETNYVTETDREGTGEQLRSPAESGPVEGCRDATKTTGRNNECSARRSSLERGQCVAELKTQDESMKDSISCEDE